MIYQVILIIEHLGVNSYSVPRDFFQHMILDLEISDEVGVYQTIPGWISTAKSLSNPTTLQIINLWESESHYQDYCSNPIHTTLKIALGSSPQWQVVTKLFNGSTTIPSFY